LLRESPEIKVSAARVEGARATLARARREPIPDLVMRGGPRYNRELLDPGPRPVGWEAFADIGIAIPLFDRNQGAVRAAAADLARAEEEHRRVELALRSRLADVFERYASERSRADVYREEIVPRAEQAYQMFLARYREMASAYPQVLIAQRALLQSTDEYLDAVASASRDAVLIEGMLLEGGLEPPPVSGR
ncbi:MAG: TolC family protein, partial [Vicinamibacterales bacterium]|nr:TolC family protein [Vicinamibacterales bacterium]